MKPATKILLSLLLVIVYMAYKYKKKLENNYQKK